MNPAWTIAKREFKSLFVSPIAYILIGIFAGVSGYFFNSLLEQFDRLLNQAQVQAQITKNPEVFNFLSLNSLVILQLTSIMFFLFVIFLPGLTMRLISEERSRGTYELLLTSPITAWDITLGKFIGCSMFFMLIVATQIPQIAIMFIFGNPEPWPVVSAYLGLTLCGLVFISVGLFASSITRNLIIAVVVAALMNFGFVIWQNMAKSASGNLAKFMEAASLFSHFESFNKGLITVSSFVYIATMIIFFLSATRIAVQSLTSG